MENFKEWLQREEALNFFLDLDEAYMGRKALLPFLAAAALGVSGVKNIKDMQPQTIQRAQEIQKQEIADLIKRVSNVDVDPYDIEMVKPIDVLKPMYGDKWQQVVNKAKESQADNKNSDAVTNVDLLNKPIPVIYADPVLFGQPKNVKGFCNTVTVGGKVQKFCVIRDRSYLNTLRHELSHTLQPATYSRKSLGGEGDFGNYFMNSKELGVRLGEFKRNYYQLTGEIVTSDPKSLEIAFKHFLKNPEKYSPDVQQLKQTIERAKAEGLLPKLLDFFRDNVDKIVVQPTKDFRGMV